MKKHNKIITAIFSVLMIGLTACGTNVSTESQINSTTAETAQNPETSSDVLSVDGIENLESQTTLSTDENSYVDGQNPSSPDGNSYVEPQNFEWSETNGTLTFFKADSDYFNYHGRWESTADGKKAHWNRPYVEFCFKGSSFKVVCADSYSYSLYIDGDKQSPSGLTTTYTVNDSKEHTVKIMSTNISAPITLKGIETTGNICRAKSREKYYMFIGDSLTYAAESYSTVIPETINCDYTCIAFGGIALVDGRGYYTIPSGRPATREGMESAFFNTQCASEQGERTSYPFTNERQPDVITINIGTNDNLTKEELTYDYISAYLKMVKKIRAIYPGSKIYILLPSADHVSGIRLNTIETAGKRIEAEVSNVKFVNTRNWSVEISSDNVHPTSSGYAVYASELMKVLGLQ